MQLLNTNSTSYKKLSELGEGSFGEVYLVQNINTGTVMVSKEMKLQGLDEATVMQLYTEVKVLETLRHPNIIKMHETYRTMSNKLVLVLEYASNGDLAHYINSREGSYIDEGQIRLWIVQLCLALKQSHDHKVVHRDLKASNVFLDEQFNVKLGDFGLAMNLLESRKNNQGMAGTPLYLSPEAITRGVCSFKGDIWSLGVVLHELCALRHPFTAANFGHLMHRICNEPIPPLPDAYTPELRGFVMSLLERDEGARPAIRELFETDFLKDVLMKHKTEFRKLISANIMNNLDLNAKGLKKDFAKMRTYRFSEYKDPSALMQNIQKIVNKEEKASKFKEENTGSNLIVSEDESDDDMVESVVNKDSSFTKGIKLNIFLPVEEDEQDEEPGKGGHIAPHENANLPDLKPADDRKPESNRQPSLEAADEDKPGQLAVITEQTGVSFYNSVLASVYDRNTKNSAEYKTTVDTADKYSKLFAEKNKALVDSFLARNCDASSNLNTPKASDTKSNRCSLYNGGEELVDSGDLEIDDSCKNTSEKVSLNYTYSKHVDSDRNSRMIQSFDSTAQGDALNSPRAQRNDRPGPDKPSKPKKSFFMQYKDNKVLQSKVPSKFKISTANSRRTQTALTDKHQSKEANGGAEDERVEPKTPVKKREKGFLVRNLTSEIGQPKSAKKENAFKLKSKGSNTAVKPKKVISVNLHSLADLPNHKNAKRRLTSLKNANVVINNKCKTITSLNNLCSLQKLNKNIDSATSNMSGKSKGKKVLKATTSIVNNFSDGLDEYGLSMATPDPTSSNNVLGPNPLSHHDVRNVQRTSKVDELARIKAMYIKKYGNRFNFVYSAVKRFLVHYGLQTVENSLNDEAKLLQMLRAFHEGDIKEFKDRKSVLGLVKLSIMEIKSDVL